MNRGKQTITYHDYAAMREGREGFLSIWRRRLADGDFRLRACYIRQFTINDDELNGAESIRRCRDDFTSKGRRNWRYQRSSEKRGVFHWGSLQRVQWYVSNSSGLSTCLSTWACLSAEDFMLCKAENRDPAHCLKEGRRVTRCAANLCVSISLLTGSTD